jgi:hypothetical protein
MRRKLLCWIGEHVYRAYTHDTDNPICDYCGHVHFMTWGDINKVRELDRQKRVIAKEITKIYRNYGR